MTPSEEKNILKDTSCKSSLKVGHILCLRKIWVQHDQGGGNRTCLQTLRLDLSCRPDPRGRRRTRRRRSNLRTYVESLLTQSDKQAHNIWKQTLIYVNLVWLRRS